MWRAILPEHHPHALHDAMFLRKMFVVIAEDRLMIECQTYLVSFQRSNRWRGAFDKADPIIVEFLYHYLWHPEEDQQINVLIIFYSIKIMISKVSGGNLVHLIYDRFSTSATSLTILRTLGWSYDRFSTTATVSLLLGRGRSAGRLGPPLIVLDHFKAYMQKTCDVAEKAILAKKNLRKKCVNRDKM